MTIEERRLLDLTLLERQADPRRADPSDLHTLRLALDLQLDAMLLTLGAAAHSEAKGENPDRGVPWRRWLVEDLDLARALAATLLEGEAAPVPGLGGGFAGASVETSLENLSARYESMEKLLLGVLERPAVGQRWRGPAAEALHRCKARLAELHEHRKLVISSTSRVRTFLPGELLG
jgi:hypothetical protein